MRIHDKDLWDLVLSQKNSLTPSRYYFYKTGGGDMSYFIAEGETSNYNDTLIEDPFESAVVNMVDILINKAVKSLNFGSRGNKTAVMCEIQDGTDKKIEVYFCTFNTHRIICTEIRAELDSVPVPA